MPFSPYRHSRHSIRLEGYDYSQAGAYFVTICTQNRACVLGSVQDGQVLMSVYGQIVVDCWGEISCRFPEITTDAFVVMPNYIHGIVAIDNVGARSPRPILGKVIGYFKHQSTKQVNALRESPGKALWQRNYYEHIVRNEYDLNDIREYILANSFNWADDRENPERKGEGTSPLQLPRTVAKHD
jgi:putative transposase